MTAQELITNEFETYVDDTTELSDTQELALLNKVYFKVLSNRPWRFLKKMFSGTISGTTVTLPADFWYMPIQQGYDNTGDYGMEKFVVLLNSQNKPVGQFKVINFEDLYQYTDLDNVCYIDLANNQLVFPKAPQYTAIRFYYIYKPDLLAAGDTPVIPAQYQYIIPHGMVSHDMSYQFFDKSRSYATKHEEAYEGYLTDLAWWDSQFYSQ